MFRHVIAGALPYPNRRVTWTLRLGSGATTLEELTEVSPKDRTTGYRVDPSFASAVFETTSLETFRGAPAADFRAGVLRLEGAKRRLDLRCAPSRVAAREPGAWLDATKQPAQWTGSPRVVEVLRCKDPALTMGYAFEELRGDGAEALDFAAPPGVEWVIENSDEVAQDGTYRLLPPARVP